MQREIVVIAHNIRSTHNVGAILRTCDGFGVEHVYCCGYTPYPEQPHDSRLPHLRQKLTKQIHKTALGAEATIPTSYTENPLAIVDQLKADGFTIAALEQSSHSTLLPSYKTIPSKIALLLGEEVQGLTPALLRKCDVALEIPMVGQKESFNVSIATGIALYALRYN